MKNKERHIYMVSLVYYDENNIPNNGATIFISSYEDLTKVPTYKIKENIYVQEEMERNDCEGIGNIQRISHGEFFAEYDEDLIVF